MPRKAAAKKVVKRAAKPVPLHPPRGHEHFHEHHLSVELYFVWRSIMAKLNDVTDALATQTAAIAALATRIPPPAAATEADLDVVKASVDSNTAQINALVP